MDPAKLDKALVTEIIHGVMTPDIDKVQATIQRHFHPQVHFIHHLAIVRGRDSLAKLYRVDHALFDIQIRVVDVGIDHDKLIALAWVDQEVYLRLPSLLKHMFSPRYCPVVTRLTFQRVNGRLMVVEQYDHVSTYYLPSLLGPWAAWAQRNITMPLGGLVCKVGSDALDKASGMVKEWFPNASKPLTRNMHGFAAVRTQ